MSRKATKSGLLSLIALMVLMPGEKAAAQGTLLLDDFEELKGWNAAASEGASLEIAQDTGHSGMGMRLDFAFKAGGGYIIARKDFSLPLPENYAFTYYMRAEAPSNNFEFKLIDPSGQNVWRHTMRDFSFPPDWRLVTVKNQHLKFAWGPAGGGVIKHVGTLEFAISVGTGGRGSVWIDELRFKEREPLGPYTLTPVVRSSTFTEGHKPQLALDQDPTTRWKSGLLSESQWLLIDFLKRREYGGLVIDWDREDYATAYEVQISDDGEDWELAYAVAAGNGGRDYISMPDTESRYLRLDLSRSSRGQGYGILSLTVKPFEFSASPNHFFEAIAREAPRGTYPKYWVGEQSYWTVVGVDGDDKEGLLNEEGMLEVDKGAFSIEPFLYAGGDLIPWSEVEVVQELERGYLPIPSVTWRHHKLVLKITAFAAGRPGASTLYARYRVENTGPDPQHVTLFLAVRPFQVNPPWQSLNMVGGTALIRELAYAGHTVWVNRDKAVVSLMAPHRFGAVSFDQGPITDHLRAGKLPEQAQVSDSFGHASGALEYGLDLLPGAAQEVYLAIPFHEPKLEEAAGEDLGQRQLEEAIRYWEAKLDRADIRLLPEAQQITQTLKSTLAYILINRDGPAIQPGSRCYARSWIRDGALTSAALLGMGYTEEVHDFIRWYAGFQFADGKVPCCVDQRGPDPVPEHDSNGEFIYAVMEYYRYTRDAGFLTEMWPHVVKAVEYIESLLRQRLTEAFRIPEKLAVFGLVPESISHEGYASHPVHSYWDNFFVLRGLKDAAAMAVVLGDEEHATHFAKLRDAFRSNLYASISRALAGHGIDYIPGSVDLGDFDPTSTAIALTPGGELQNLPEPALTRTFEKYKAYFLQRQRGEIPWEAYTPYELRNVGALIRLGQRGFALEALNFFLADQRPRAWNQWPEIVWRDPTVPEFIGDMPHTWVGSGFILSMRSLFAFEREADQALVIAAGLPREWVERETGVTVKRLPTYYGTLNYSLRSDGPGGLRLSLSGDLVLPPGKIVVKPPLPQPLKGVTVNGRAITTFDAEAAILGEFPAEVVLQY